MGQAKQELLYLSNEISNKFKTEVREASEITSKIKALQSKIEQIDWSLNQNFVDISANLDVTRDDVRKLKHEQLSQI